MSLRISYLSGGLLLTICVDKKFLCSVSEMFYYQQEDYF